MSVGRTGQWPVFRNQQIDLRKRLQVLVGDLEVAPLPGKAGDKKCLGYLRNLLNETGFKPVWRTGLKPMLLTERGRCEDEQPMGKIKRPSRQKFAQAVCLVALKFICSKPYYRRCFAAA